jgi:protein required for attachment to host cells
MNRVAIAAGTWVLVCDGAKSLLFENIGDAQAIHLKLIETNIDSHPPTHELGTERPGRAYDSMDGSRSAMAITDWHATSEEQFLRRVAERLNGFVAAGRIRRVIIVAPPKSLGVLRDRFSTALRDAISAEIARDLVKMPTAEIERILAEHSGRPVGQR